MESPQDYSLVTQTAEYVVAVVGLLLFIPLWKLVTKPTRAQKRRIGDDRA